MNTQKGFIGRLILILVALFFIASYFNFDIKAFIESPGTQKNLKYVTGLGQTVWKGYLEKPTQYFWNNILSGFIKEAFKQNLNNLNALKEGNFGQIKLTPAIPQGLIPTLPQ